MANEALARFNKMYSEAERMLPRECGETNSVASHKARLAIVFGVAAMDAYFTQKFLNYLTKYLKGMKDRPRLEGKQNEKARANINEQDKALEKLLFESGVTPAFYRDQFEKKRHYRGIHSLVRQHLQSRWTTQRFNRIDQLFNMYGINSLSNRALAEARKQITQKGGLNLAKSIEAMVTRRNQICHECDMNSRKELRAVELTVIKRNLDVIKFFVCAADTLINEEMG